MVLQGVQHAPHFIVHQRVGVLELVGGPHLVFWQVRIEERHVLSGLKALVLLAHKLRMVGGIVNDQQEQRTRRLALLAGFQHSKGMVNHLGFRGEPIPDVAAEFVEDDLVRAKVAQVLFGEQGEFVVAGFQQIQQYRSHLCFAKGVLIVGGQAVEHAEQAPCGSVRRRVVIPELAEAAADVLLDPGRDFKVDDVMAHFLGNQQHDVGVRRLSFRKGNGLQGVAHRLGAAGVHGASRLGFGEAELLEPPAHLHRDVEGYAPSHEINLCVYLKQLPCKKHLVSQRCQKNQQADAQLTPRSGNGLAERRPPHNGGAAPNRQHGQHPHGQHQQCGRPLPPTQIEGFEDVRLEYHLQHKAVDVELELLEDEEVKHQERNRKSAEGQQQPLDEGCSKEAEHEENTLKQSEEEQGVQHRADAHLPLRCRRNRGREHKKTGVARKEQRPQQELQENAIPGGNSGLRSPIRRDPVQGNFSWHVCAFGESTPRPPASAPR